MMISALIHNYWYFSRRYAQFEIVSSLIAAMIEDESTISPQAQMALKELNEKRFKCQERIGSLKLSTVAECHACRGLCCDRASGEYFSPLDYWLR